MCPWYPICRLSDIHVSVQIHAGQQKYNESCIFNFIFSSSNIKKYIKKTVKSVLTYIVQPNIQSIMIPHVTNIKVINDVFYILFLIKY